MPVQLLNYWDLMCLSGCFHSSCAPRGPWDGLFLLESKPLFKWRRLSPCPFELYSSNLCCCCQFYRGSEFCGGKCLFNLSESLHATSRYLKYWYLRNFPWPVDTLWTNLQGNKLVCFPSPSKKCVWQRNSVVSKKPHKPGLEENRFCISFVTQPMISSNSECENHVF